ENALVDYPGTILFVSHDRYFINRIATKVVELSPEGTAEFLGDYDYYTEKTEEMQELARLEAAGSAVKAEASTPSNKQSYQQDKEAKKLERQRQRRIEEIENRMEVLEEEIRAREELLCSPGVFEDHEQVMELNQGIEERQSEIVLLMEEWEQLME
ncbi:MAG TPA: multidrug ABC transporter ATP-binding protein, partial [Bacillaceae bacterium]